MTDIKPDNIMVNCKHEDQTTTVVDVQLTDLENAAYIPERRCIKGMLAETTIGVVQKRILRANPANPLIYFHSASL